MSNKYLDIIKPAIDQYGIIAQLAGDGGDSSQREGMFLLLSYAGYKQGKITSAEFQLIQDRYTTIYDRLRKGCMPGEIRRHDGSAQWYDKNWNMSRDQWTPNAISLGLVGTSKQKFDMVLGYFMRLTLFTTNIYNNGSDPGPKKLPDITVLSAHGFMLRWAPWVFFPFLCITDLDLLIGSIIWRYNFKNDPTNTDILNQVNALIQAKYRTPTPISWLARKILPLGNVQDCLNRYFSNGGPALNVIAQDVLPGIW